MIKNYYFKDQDESILRDRLHHEIYTRTYYLNQIQTLPTSYKRRDSSRSIDRDTMLCKMCHQIYIPDWKIYGNIGGHLII